MLRSFLKPLSAAFGLGFWACTAPVVWAHGNHTHGHGTVLVQQEGAVLHLTLDVPLEAYLGFDYPPRQAAQQQIWETFQSRVRDPLRFVSPNEEAACVLREHATVPDVQNLDPQADPANLILNVRFECAQEAQLKSLSFPAFAAYPGLKQLRVQSLRRGVPKTTTVRPRFPAWMF